MDIFLDRRQFVLEVVGAEQMRLIFVFQSIIILQLVKRLLDVVIWWDGKRLLDIVKDEYHIPFYVVKWVLFFEILSRYDVLLLLQFEVDDLEEYIWNFKNFFQPAFKINLLKFVIKLSLILDA